MDYSSSSLRTVPRSLLFLLGLIVGVILYAGLNPLNHPFRNGASWSVDAPGITFEDTGIAYTLPFVGLEEFIDLSETGFTMELAIEIPGPAETGFMFLANFHSGEESSQLFLGQWERSLILMNGDDYDHSRRLPRLSANLAQNIGRPILITCTSDGEGTRIYIDGKLKAERNSVKLEIPGGSPSGRLVFGNSVYGKYPWKGRLMGFALFSRGLGAGEIRANYARWRDSGQFWAEGSDHYEMLIPFDEGRGEVAYDRSGKGRNVEVRSDVTFLRRRAFENPLGGVRINSGFRRDVVINLVGFVPFGCVFMGVYGLRRNRSTISNLVIVTAIGFALSAGIEFSQSWFPARNSSSLDLLLNTGGSGLGAWGWVMTSRLLR